MNQYKNEENGKMSTLTVKEATSFFRSYGLKCDEKWVQEWMDDSKFRRNTQEKNHQISEADLEDFNDWSSRKGTAYEIGIDDKTRIKRLIEEVSELRKEIDQLKMEKYDLESRLGLFPF